MKENINNRWICVQCACHLENSFKFCPKCGLKLSQPLNKETSARSVENDQLSVCEAQEINSTSTAYAIECNSSPARIFCFIRHWFSDQTSTTWFFNLQDRKRKGAARIQYSGGKKKNDVLSRSTWLFQWESWEKTRNQGEATPFQ